MADLTGARSDLPVGITGLSTSGVPTTPVGSDTNGNLLTVHTKVSLTPASPATASIGTTSSTPVAFNASRKGLTIVNVSINKVSFGLGVAAVLNSGITLYPGGTWVMDDYTFTTASINAIAGAAASSISIQEFNT